jgi:addiction module RelE/StbE family toxin
VKPYKLTKQSFKKLKLIANSDPKLAKQIKTIINKLREDTVSGETLKGFSDFKKIRIHKFRLIYTIQNEVVIIALIEKRETVYTTFAHLLKNSQFLE